MKINLDQPVRFPDGQEAKFNDQPLTFRQMLLKAVMAVFEVDQTNPLESRVYLMSLAQRLNNKTESTIDLTLMDVVVLTNRIVSAYVQPSVVFDFLRVVERAQQELTLAPSITDGLDD